MTVFSAKTLDFLFENKLHDSKDWFTEHKQQYRELVFDPLHDLVETLAPQLLKIDDKLTVEPRVDRTICRIRRDTRFTHDKSIYRANMWIVFKRGKMHGTEVPGIYFDISGEGFSYGCGFYSASAEYMQTMRELILAGHPAFKKAYRAFRQQDIFHMDGDRYKRSKFAGRPEALRFWLDRKGISFNADSKDFDLLFSDRLAEKLIQDFAVLKPLYDFLLFVSEERIAKNIHSPSK